MRNNAKHISTNVLKNKKKITVVNVNNSLCFMHVWIGIKILFLILDVEPKHMGFHGVTLYVMYVIGN